MSVAFGGFGAIREVTQTPVGTPQLPKLPPVGGVLGGVPPLQAAQQAIFGGQGAPGLLTVGAPIAFPFGFSFGGINPSGEVTGIKDFLKKTIGSRWSTTGISAALGGYGAYIGLSGVGTGIANLERGFFGQPGFPFAPFGGGGTPSGGGGGGGGDGGGAPNYLGLIILVALILGGAFILTRGGR